MATTEKRAFGERLRQARVMRGYSLRGLAKALEGRVSHAALQKYERGEAYPGSEVLLALAEVLNLRPDYFFHPRPVTLSGIEFRKRTTFGKKAAEQVREQAREFFERYLEIEAILGIEPPALPRQDLDGAANLGEAVETAAEAVREAWKLGLNTLANVHEMLEDRGVKVAEVGAAGAFDGFSGWADGNPIIVLADWLNDDLPRKRLTALHELGHLVLNLPQTLSKKDEETICFRFANAMLIPRTAFMEEFGPKRRSGQISLQELVALKEQWGVSIAAIMKRAEQLGLVSQEAYKRFNITFRQRGWHKEEPGEWVGSEYSSRFSQLAHRAAAQEVITRSKAAGLLGLTLREFDRQFGSVSGA
ncbi:MAG: helix-turn-helix domain-containing protein [Candidatus Hydrogenedentota bacterium]